MALTSEMALVGEAAMLRCSAAAEVAFIDNPAFGASILATS
jgi:hypothetical protein